MKNEHGHNDHRRLPPWMKRTVRETRAVTDLKKRLRQRHLHTVCESAGCPNLTECFQKPTATFMILGNVCTRNCRFCGVAKGAPERLNPREAAEIGEAVLALGLRHAVITSVTRDDLADGGAAQFAETVRAIRAASPGTTIETLIPDFNGSVQSLAAVLASGVDILNHNVETVPALYSLVRPEADFERSLDVLSASKRIDPGIITKSGIMVGLGETEEQVLDLFHRLAKAACDALTIGQYLAPNRSSYPVQEYVPPERFDFYRETAEKAGISHVYAGPYVRSSYNAESLMAAIEEGRYA
ncbi:lipoyl synthase [bacterium]|nr:lipoyl synthase [bacterium]